MPITYHHMKIHNQPLFERLLKEAWEYDFSGWDWSYLDGRAVESPLSWDYPKIVFDQSRNVRSLLDIGTGGGEFLATLQPFPPQVFAAESYPPNLEVARKTLEPLGVKVIGVREEDPLPFEENSLDLVINRHASYSAAEVNRILKPGCGFITQQVGGENNLRFNEILQEKVEFIYSYWTLDYAANELARAGFEIIRAVEDFPETAFYDIGAVVFHLKIISWQVEGFTVEKYYPKLALIHNMIQEEGQFVVNSHRFLIEARK
jgi:SAM-dependent methyltransferase